MQNSSVVDFLSNNKINYFPISIRIKEDGKKELVKINGRFPKTSDFNTISVQEIKERQKTKLSHIAIDTNNIYHIDVDFKDDIEYSKEEIDFVNELKAKCPYYKSSSKERGLHIFFKSKNVIDNNSKKLKFLKDKEHSVELLSGLWGWCKSDAIVYNSNYNIPTLDLEEYYHKKEIKKVSSKSKIKKEIKKINTISYTNTDNEIIGIAKNINIEYLDDYDTWTRIIWSLSSYKKTMKNTAILISKKSTKYNEETFNKIWNQSMQKINIGTLYYYSRMSNKEEHFKIKDTYSENVTEDWGTDDVQADIFLKDNLINLVMKDDEVYINIDNIWYKDLKHNKLRNSISIYLIDFFKTKIKRDKEQKQKYNDLINSINTEQELSNYTALVDDEEKIIEEKIRLEIKNKKSIQEIKLELLTLEDKMIHSKEFITRLKSVSRTKAVSEKVIQKLSFINFDNIEFDNNGYLFPFNDKVYDLKTHQLRDFKREDYIILKTDYSYIKSNEEQLNKLDTLISSILPNKNIKKNYLQYLACGLYGVPIEKFVIANGDGGNGKGVLSELMETTLSDSFFYSAPSSILLEPLKQGSNPAVANMHRKRMIIYREPNTDKGSGKKINGSVMKELTGGKTINARLNHSNDCKITLCGVNIMECNSRGKIDGRIDNSYLRRMADVPFQSTFSSNETEYNNPRLKKDKNYFKADPYFKSDEFIQEYKTVMFDYLINFIKSNDDFECNRVVDCEEVIERTKLYLEDSDEFYNWFITVYRKVSDTENYITAKEIFEKYKESDDYNNMNRNQKRETTKKSIVEYLSSDSKFRLDYYDTKRVYISSVRTRIRNFLVGYKVIDNEFSDNEEEEEEEEDTDSGIII